MSWRKSTTKLCIVGRCSASPGPYARDKQTEPKIYWVNFESDSVTRIFKPVISVSPFRSEGQHPQLVNEANTDSLTLRPVALPSRNLQHMITHVLLRSNTGGE